jgi:hypothetical protein
VSESPTQLPQIEVQVADVILQSDNALWLRLRFEDDTYLSLEFPVDSPVSQNLVELVERGANDMLRRLGQRGVRVTGFTPPDEPEDG